MNIKLPAKIVLSTSFVIVPNLAFAHTAIGDTSGFAHGFAHPLSGIDHVLAMIMVGLFATQLGGRTLWLAPASFVAGMTFGGALGLAGIEMPLVELGIALSVVVLGVLVASEVKASIAAAMALVGFFAVFHGHAHGAEMPENVGGWAYAVGFVIATSLLHMAGIGAGLLLGCSTKSTRNGSDQASVVPPRGAPLWDMCIECQSQETRRR